MPILQILILLFVCMNNIPFERSSDVISAQSNSMGQGNSNRYMIWNFVSVNPLDTAEYASMALDSNDNTHISYYDNNNGELKYVFYDGIVWHTETVPSENNLGRFNSIALDSKDNPHISFHDSTRRYLKYAYYDTDQWIIETVDSDGDVGYYTSIMLDSEDKPHISYYDNDNEDLKYSHKNGDQWETEIVDEQDQVGLFTSIALDSKDRPHISYHYKTEQDLKYAYFDGSQWHTETVDDKKWAGEYTSIALDSEDKPHISYHDGYYRNLKYARFDGTEWTNITIDEGDNVGESSSLKLDSEDKPHISYYFNGGGRSKVKYAYFDGNNWDIETLYTKSFGWSYWLQTSLELDSSGNPHISFINYTNKGLVYACFPPTKPRTPSSPTDPDIISSKNIVELYWNAPLSDGGSRVLYYNIYRESSAEEKSIITTVQENKNSYVDESITASSTYYYSITAVNDIGESDPTDRLPIFISIEDDPPTKIEDKSEVAIGPVEIYSDASEDEIVVANAEWNWTGKPEGDDAHNYTDSPPGRLDFTIDKIGSTLDIVQMKYFESSDNWNFELTVKGEEYPFHSDIPTYLYVEFPNSSIMIFIQKNSKYYATVAQDRDVSWKGEWWLAIKPLSVDVPRDRNLTIKVPKSLSTGEPLFFSGIIYNGEFGWFYVDHFESNISSSSSSNNDGNGNDDRSSIAGSPKWLAISGGGIILLVIFIVFIVRNKRKNELEDDEDEDDEPDYHEELNVLEQLRKKNKKTGKAGSKTASNETDKKRIQNPASLPTANRVEPTCIKCSSPLIPSNSIFCSYCGTNQNTPVVGGAGKISGICLYCRGVLIPPDSEFCHRCGKKQLLPEGNDPSKGTKRCIDCGTPIGAHLVFCDMCVQKQKAVSQQTSVTTVSVQGADDRAGRYVQPARVPIPTISPQQYTPSPYPTIPFTPAVRKNESPPAPPPPSSSSQWYGHLQ